MKCVPIVAAVIMMACIFITQASAQSTAFSYQGSLSDNGGLADGLYDFQFTLYSSLSGGSAVGTDEHLGVMVMDGLFNVELDFGSIPFDLGEDRFLEIEVRLDGDPSYSTLDPRVQIDSVPFANHADVADIAEYALNGPFEPQDSTLASSSGVAGQVISTSLEIGGDIFTNAEPVFPIKLTRDFFNTGMDLIPGDYHDFSIEFSIPYNSANQLKDHFDQATTQVQIVIATDAAGSNRTTFTLSDGVVTSYRLEQNGFLVEVIKISFLQFGPGTTPLTSFLSRSTNGFNPVGHGPFSPHLGGDSVLPGSYFYSYDGYIPLDSSVGVFPGEERVVINGSPSNLVDQRSLTLLHNVYQDQSDILWNVFAGGHSGSEPLELRDAFGAIWVAPSPSLITSWTLDIADDGGLFETFEFEYIASPQFP